MVVLRYYNHFQYLLVNIFRSRGPVLKSGVFFWIKCTIGYIMARKIIFVLPNGREVSPHTLAKLLKPLSRDENHSEELGIPLLVEPNAKDYLATLSNALASVVKQGKSLTKDQLAEADFTAILRIAGIKKLDDTPLFPSVTASLQKHMGFRGLPINLTIKNNAGKVVSVKLHKHQIDGINHIREREEVKARVDSFGLCGSILKLEMGLGKTLLAIVWSLISPRPPCPEIFGESGFPTLIIASKTVMIEWRTEGFQKFFGSGVKVLYYHKDFIPPSEYKNISRRELVGYDFVISTYDVVCAAAREGREVEAVLEMGDDHTLMKGKIVSVHCRTRLQANGPHITGHRILFHTPWERVIADESQRFANPDTYTYKAMMALYGKYKLCLTGTPIRNYDTDIWAQLRWCGYTGIKRKVEWKRNGAAMMRYHSLNRAILSVETKDTEIVLPGKVIAETNAKFEGMEKQAYEFVVGVARNVYDQMMASMVDFACVLALFTRLRQMCIAPYLITAESKREKPKAGERKNDMLAKQYLQPLYQGPLSAWVKDKNGTAGIRSAKMQLIIQELADIPKGEKVIIFSMFTSCLDLLGDAIREFMPKDYIFEQLDGDTPGGERKEVLQNFRENDSVRSLLMTYKVGSEGLNLTRGNHVICIEPWWTYAVPLQAEARSHRPGQTREVIVHNIYIEGTIEQRVLAICEEKKEMAKNFLEGTTRNLKSGIDKYTLGRILGRYK